MKKTRRLRLHRETLRCLEEPSLHLQQGGKLVALPVSEEKGCMSPLCGPTFWQGCQETALG